MDYEIVELQTNHLSSVAQLHVRAFDGYFLSRMGERFVLEYYRCYLLSPYAVAYTALSPNNHDGDVIGFVTGADDVVAFYNQTFRRQFWTLVAAATLRCLGEPGLITELWHRRGRVLGPLFARILGRKSSVPSEVPVLPAASLTSIAVDPRHLRQGIAKALVSVFLEELRDRGAPAVKLGVLSQNVPACAFYERLGWQLAYEGKPSYKGASRTYVLQL